MLRQDPILTRRYKGFIIEVNNYLVGINGITEETIDVEKSSKCYYRIWNDGKLIYDTLSNDDAMWTIESAMHSAMKDIDELT